MDRDRFVFLARENPYRKNHAALVADGGAGLVSDRLRRRIEHLHGGDIIRAGKVEARRDAGVARIAPISMPTWLELDLDTGAQALGVAFVGAGDQPHRGA